MVCVMWRHISRRQQSLSSSGLDLGLIVSKHFAVATPKLQNGSLRKCNVNSLIHQLTHSLTHPPTHSFTHSLTILMTNDDVSFFTSFLD